MHLGKRRPPDPKAETFQLKMKLPNQKNRYNKSAHGPQAPELVIINKIVCKLKSQEESRKISTQNIRLSALTVDQPKISIIN